MVYVDDLRNWGGSPTFPWPRSCHMWADTLDELNAMADKIGLRREWIQTDGIVNHYDLTAGRRGAAINNGARYKRSPGHV